MALNLEKQCTKVEESAGGLTVYFGDGETVECDLMLVAVGRGPTVENLGLEQIGALEPKPGVPPTSSHLSGLVALAKSAPAYAIVVAAYQDE